MHASLIQPPIQAEGENPFSYVAEGPMSGTYLALPDKNLSPYSPSLHQPPIDAEGENPLSYVAEDPMSVALPDKNLSPSLPDNNRRTFTLPPIQVKGENPARMQPRAPRPAHTSLAKHLCLTIPMIFIPFAYITLL
jgi:hypothetical protein